MEHIRPILEWLYQVFGPGGLPLAVFCIVAAVAVRRLYHRNIEIQDARMAETRIAFEALRENAASAQQLSSVIDKLADRIEYFDRTVRDCRK